MSIFGFLVILGALLYLAGSFTHFIQAFQVSLLWGFLHFLPIVPLVFLIKFWTRRRWLRRALFMRVAGFFMMLLGSLSDANSSISPSGGLYTNQTNLIKLTDEESEPNQRYVRKTKHISRR